MKEATAKLDNFLYCLNTNPQDKTHFLAGQNLHFLNQSLLCHSMQYCRKAGTVVQAHGGTDYSSLTVRIQLDSNLAERTATVPPLPMFVSTCQLLSAEMEMQSD